MKLLTKAGFILFTGRLFKTGVTRLGPGGTVGVLQSLAPSPILIKHLNQLIKLLEDRNFPAGVLRQVETLNSAGHRPSRIKFCDPWFKISVV